MQKDKEEEENEILVNGETNAQNRNVFGAFPCWRDLIFHVAIATPFIYMKVKFALYTKTHNECEEDRHECNVNVRTNERTIWCFMLWFAAVGWSLNAFVIVRVLIKSYRFFLNFFSPLLLLLFFFYSFDSFIDAWGAELSSRVFFLISSFTEFSTYHFGVANAM